MRKIFRWFKRQPRERPFFSVLVILLIVVVPGYFRLEYAIDQNRDNARELAIAHAFDERRDDDIALAACQTRNTANRNSRDRFTTFINVLEGLLVGSADSPEQAQRSRDFIAQLKAGVETSPEVEDVDCNDDGQLTSHDYG